MVSFNCGQARDLGFDTPERLLEEYPFLEPADIQACLTYAHRALSGEQIQERIAAVRGS